MIALIVEDDVPLLRAIAGAFQHRGHLVQEARNAARALALLDEQRVDCVITDLSVPGGGLEVAKAVARQHPGTLAVIYSGREAPRDLPPGVRFVQKPISPFELVATVERWEAEKTG